MQRTNVYLDDDQLRMLRHLATEERKSVADLVRQAVDTYLMERVADDAAWREQFNQLLERIRNRVKKSASSEQAEVGNLVAFKAAQDTSTIRLPRGKSGAKRYTDATPRYVLRKLIIEVLRECGGKARCVYVVDRVGEKLNGRFLPDDWQEDENGEPIWRKNTRWARQDMVQDGTLRKGSSHGTWELPA